MECGKEEKGRGQGGVSFAFVKNVHPPSESEITRCSLVGVDVERVGAEEKDKKRKDWAASASARAGAEKPKDCIKYSSPTLKQ